MCENHKDLAASEVRHLPVEARRMDRPVLSQVHEPQVILPPLHSKGKAVVNGRQSGLRPQDVLPALTSLPAKPKVVELKSEPVKASVVSSVEKAAEVSDDVTNLRERIRRGASSVLADEARLPTGRAAKAERMKFREEAVQRYAKGLKIDLPSGQANFDEAANILRAKLMETFDAVETEKLMPRFLRNKEA